MSNRGAMVLGLFIVLAASVLAAANIYSASRPTTIETCLELGEDYYMLSPVEQRSPELKSVAAVFASKCLR